MTSAEFDAHSREMRRELVRLRVLSWTGVLAAAVMLGSVTLPSPWPWRIACGVTLACQSAHLWLGRRIDRKQRSVLDALLADIAQTHDQASRLLSEER